MKLIDVPALWHVRLTGGALMHVWADGYSIVRGHYVFDVLATASVAYQAEVEVTVRTPADPERVCIAVARIPVGAVEELHTASSECADV